VSRICQRINDDGSSPPAWSAAASTARLVWETARDNHRAQAVYQRLGATREDRWLDYQLPVDPG
jgi:hypothetical protein